MAAASELSLIRCRRADCAQLCRTPQEARRHQFLHAQKDILDQNIAEAQVERMRLYKQLALVKTDQMLPYHRQCVDASETRKMLQAMGGLHVSRSDKSKRVDEEEAASDDDDESLAVQLQRVAPTFLQELCRVQQRGGRVALACGRVWDSIRCNPNGKAILQNEVCRRYCDLTL